MVQFGSIWVSGPLSGGHISNVRPDKGSGRSVRISSLGSVSSNLAVTPLFLPDIEKIKKRSKLKLVK